MSSSSSSPSSLDPLTLRQLHALLELALAEDVSDGDVSTLATVPADSLSRATFLAKDDGVLSGIAVATEVFNRVDSALKVEWSAQDGDRVTRGTQFGTVFGSSRSLLSIERIVLNLMQRMSGIATATAHFVQLMNSPSCKLLDTRKTVPGLRLLDKMAVRHGGGVNHRIGLFDMVMIKDNHIEAAGGIKKAVEAARSFLKQRKEEKQKQGASDAAQDLEIEVEARTLGEVREVLACGDQVQRIMLDNMVSVTRDPHTHTDKVDTWMLQQAMEIIREYREKHPEHKLLTEASGNVSGHSIAAIAQTGVDFISMGALTHSVKALDISMKIKREK